MPRKFSERLAAEISEENSGRFPGGIADESMAELLRKSKTGLFKKFLEKFWPKFRDKFLDLEILTLFS